MVVRGDRPDRTRKGNSQNLPAGEHSFPFRPTLEHSSYIVPGSGKRAGLSAISSLPLMASYCPTRTVAMVNENTVTSCARISPLPDSQSHWGGQSKLMGAYRNTLAITSGFITV